MATDDKTVKLRFNCYLIRPEITNVETALRPKYRAQGRDVLSRIDGSRSAPKGSVAFFGTSAESTPKWAEEMDRLFPGVAEAVNRSNRLIIFLPVGRRLFAACFGYGSAALEWDAVESNFGLRVAARRFRPANVTELRSRRIDASARTQSVQVPVGTELKDLGVELEGEFVRKLAGRLDADGASDISGAVVAGDSIAFKAETDLHEVQNTLERMLTSVAETAAQDEFQFVDSLEPLRTNEKMAKALDKLLSSQILEKDPVREDGSTVSDLNTHVLEFAPPDDIRLDEVEDITVSYSDRSATMTQFTMEALRQALKKLGVKRGVGFLRDVRLIAGGADGQERSQLIPLKNWLVFEAGNTVSRYVLTLGRWFRLQESYTKKLNADLRRIADVTTILKLPNTTTSEHERPYNEATANGRADLLLMDRVMIKTEDGMHVEACDLLSTDGYLVHVKRYNGSQTLSHLFSQGAISAELLNSDEVMKDDFVDAVKTRGAQFEQAALDAPVIVTYAIALKDSLDLPLDLPTFSKVNLRDFAKRLRRMGVKPTLARIRVI